MVFGRNMTGLSAFNNELGFMSGKMWKWIAVVRKKRNMKYPSLLIFADKAYFH